MAWHKAHYISANGRQIAKIPKKNRLQKREFRSQLCRDGRMDPAFNSSYQGKTKILTELLVRA